MGLTLATIAALGASSYYFSRDSANQLRARVLDDIARDIYGEIVRLLQTAQNQTAYNRERIQRGEVQPEDFPRLAAAWLHLFAIHPELSFIALSLDSGDTLRIARAPDRHIYLQEWRYDAATKKRHMKVFLPQAYPDRPHHSVTQEGSFDIRQQPWFRAAQPLRQGEHGWTETYGFRDEHAAPTLPGTTCVTPLHRADGTRIGFLRAGVDVLLLSSYLETLNVGKQGTAFVAELHDSKPPSVIAFPPADVVWRTTKAENRELVPTAEISDARVRAFMAQLPPTIDHDNVAFIPVEFTHDGVGYVGGYQYLKGSATPDWLICIVMPESDIMANVWRNNWIMLGVGLATLAAAVLTSLYLARQVARPLEQVVSETKAIGRLDCEPRPAVHSHVQEVTDLGVALEEMKTSLRSFQKYVPVDLVRALMQSKQEAYLGGTSCTLTVFFSDIANFTAICEECRPHELVKHLGEYLEAMSAQTIATGGTVDKYIGDAIMAFWGAPLPNPQHALSACTAALRSQAVLRELRQKWQAAGTPPFAARIGLNTGEVVVGNIGSEKRLNYTVIGDAVNVASRLEGLNKHYGTEIIISESTFQAAGSEIVARPLDWVSVKGKTQAVLAYELLGLRATLEPGVEEMARLYAEALASYRKQDWQLALELFDKVLRLCPGDAPSMKMVARCREYQTNSPGENWDGVFHLSEK